MRRVYLPLFGVFLCLVAQQWLSLSLTACAADDDRWEKEIAALTANDASKPPPSGGIVFVGSSSFRLWDIQKSFPDLPIINRGFGGSELADSVRHADRIVLPYKPKTVVLYAGDNDLANKVKPDKIAADFDAFVAFIRKGLTDAKIIYVPVKPSPARWNLFDQQTETNGLIRKRCEQGENLVYVDIVTPMLAYNGKPRDELFKDDKLHMNDKGYEIWTELLRPLLQ